MPTFPLVPRLYRLAAAALLAILVACPREAEAAPRKVVLVAGPITGHPKDAHEYERVVGLLRHLLEGSNVASSLRVEVHLGGWPADESTLSDADTVVFVTDGGDHRETDHPLHVPGRLERLEKELRRGCGLVHFHWSTFHPARLHERTTEWVGGYFDYETGTGSPPWRSKIEHGTWQVTPGVPDHPILRGVKPFEVREEFYYQIRFRDGDNRLRPLLRIERGSGLEGVVGWAVERADGGRGVGFTGGHFYENYWNPDFRRFVLNAIVWSARVEVPASGVEGPGAERWKALVVTGHNHPAHDWRAVTAALVPALELDPRARVEVTEDPESLADLKPDRARVIVLNYCNWDRPGLSPAARTALLGHVNEGGGLVVVHFANGAFNATLPRADSDWEEYRTQLVRRVWNHGEGHSGHDAFGPFRVDVADGGHEVTRGLAPFETVDELYFKQEGSAPIHTLLTARSGVTGSAEPMAWVHEVGRGRVFVSVLGHSAQSVQKAVQVFRRGAAWAAGAPPLGFDPPTSTLEKYLWREGAQWSPEASRAREGRTGRADPAARREAAPAAELLPPNPGVDGGAGGHWGIQTETSWKDARWSRSEIGSFLSCTLPTPGGLVARAIAVRLGDDQSVSAAFDEDACSVRAAWRGDFLVLGERRFGIIESPRPAGSAWFHCREGPLWTRGGAPLATRYRGLRIHGNRVVFHYELDRAGVADSPWAFEAGDLQLFTRLLRLEGPREELELDCLAGDGALRAEESGPGNGTLATASARGDGRAVFAAWRGPPGVTPRVAPDGSVKITVAAGDQPLEGEIVLWAGRGPELERVSSLVKTLPSPVSMSSLLEPAGRRWGEPLPTKGELGTGPGPHVIDTITLPFENPLRALLFLTGHDFLPDGAAAVSTVHGDVWLVRGIDATLEHLTWQRFATGLYQPLGLRVVDGKVHVLGRDQITRLTDENGDGEADDYARFAAPPRTLTGGHDFSTCLETDREGSFYFASPEGLHRFSADGKEHEIVAAGWRNPNGISVGPDGTLTVAPQEGEWTPASQICEVRRGGWYGYPGPRPSPELPGGRDLPLCWIPRSVDNSTGGQVWVAGDRWGIGDGQLLNLSFGASSHQLILRDHSGGVSQGAVVPLRGRFRSGVARGRFHPGDGQLYVTGLRGWVTNAVEDGCFQRVRSTGAPLRLPVGFSARSNGVRLDFSEPLDAAAARDLRSYTVSQWGYRYSSSYGSEEYSIADPTRVGHDPVAVSQAVLLEGNRSVFLEIPRLAPVDQLHVHAALRTENGEDLDCDVYITVRAPGPGLEVPGAGEDVPSPADAPPTGPEAPGLILRLTGVEGGVEEVRVSRLAALALEQDEPAVVAGAVAPFLAEWVGSIVIEESGSYRWSLEGTGTSQLWINDTEVAVKAAGGPAAPSTWVRLPRGHHPIRLRFDSGPRSGPSWLRLYWEGRSFARETVPARLLRHDPSTPDLVAGLRRARGIELLVELRCAACHPTGARGAGNTLGLAGPPLLSLETLALRIEPAWLVHVAAAPWVLSPGSHMPAVWRSGRGNATRAAELFLAESMAQRPEFPEPAEEEHFAAGRQLFTDLRCEACHLSPGVPLQGDEHGRLGLAHLNAKWRTGALRTYLERPREVDPGGKMPDFRLSPGEAADLEVYLLSSAPAAAGLPVLAAASDAAQVLEEGGCGRCHPGATGGGPPVPRPRRSLREMTPAILEARGCVSRAPGGPREVWYSLGEDGRAALLDGLALFQEQEGLVDLGRAHTSATEEIERLRCGACHERDGIPSRWQGLEDPREASPGSDDPPRRSDVPSLSLAGEQFKGDWLSRYLEGEREGAVRPWLKVRMPAFPGRGRDLARRLAAEHGVPVGPEPPRGEEPVPPSSVELGLLLLGPRGGFGCVTCHPVGGRPALMVQEFGVTNLAVARRRLREEHYVRWLLGPQRISPLTPMPAFADEQGRSILGGIHGGDARAQFRAIWAALAAIER